MLKALVLQIGLTNKVKRCCLDTTPNQKHLDKSQFCVIIDYDRAIVPVIDTQRYYIMASSKEMQARAKARREAEKQQAKFEAMPKLNLYKTRDFAQDNGVFNSIILPEGLQAYRTATANVAVILKGDTLPVDTWMTAYGLSYVSKVRSGTPRAKEIQINVFAESTQGDMLQLFGTCWDDVNDKPASEFNARELAAQAIASLPQHYQKLFVGKILKMEYGISTLKVGLVSDDRDANQTALEKAGFAA